METAGKPIATKKQKGRNSWGKMKNGDQLKKAKSFR